MAMEFSGEYRIPVPREQVWEALNDPAALQACIAGCTRLERTADNEFEATVQARVGPIAVTFRGGVTLSDLEPPHRYTLTGQGRGGAAGFAKMCAVVTLEADGATTVLHYDAQAEIGGKLASLGSRLVQTVAKKNADDFFGALTRRLGGGETPQEAALAPSAAAQASPASAVAPAPLGRIAQTVPAWIAVFTAALGVALGYCLAYLR